MNLKNKTASFLLIATILVSAGCSMSDEEPPPNILLLVADDLGWSDIGAYGSEVATPNLDALAFEGVRFTQFHTVPKCFPSRATMLTGLYPEQVGRATEPYSAFSAGTTIAESLSAAGYRTYMVGKHHGTDNPLDFGFDHYSGLRDGASNHFNPGISARPGEPEPARKRGIREAGRWFCFDRECQRGWMPDDPDYYSTDNYTDWALGYLEDAASAGQPFFLYVAYQAPHDPLHAWPEDIGRYQIQYRDGYELIGRNRYRKMQELGLIDDSFPRAAATHRDWGAMTVADRSDAIQRMAVYSAMIDRLDQNIGRLVARLQETGELDNTLIVFTSDNGASAELVFAEDSDEEIGAEYPIGTVGRWASLGADWANVSNTPFRMYKNYSHEGGSAVPLILHWPSGIDRAGAIVHDNTHAIDLVPTLLAAADTRAGGDITLPGIDLTPYLGSDETPHRNDPTFTRWSKGRSVRTARWKLVSWAGDEESAEDGQWQLYDMWVDKTETDDVAAEHPEVVRDLAAAYGKWLESVTD